MPAPRQGMSRSSGSRRAPAQTEHEFALDWRLKPESVPAGGRFRLLFLSTTRRDARSADIADYNTLVQTDAAAGETNIQAYADGFKAVGSTAMANVRANTLTRAEDTDAAIYWLQVLSTDDAVAEGYADFWHGTWGNTTPRSVFGLAQNWSRPGNGVATGSLLNGNTSATGPLGTALADVQTWYADSSGNVAESSRGAHDTSRLLGLSPVFLVLASPKLDGRRCSTGAAPRSPWIPRSRRTGRTTTGAWWRPGSPSRRPPPTPRRRWSTSTPPTWS